MFIFLLACSSSSKDIPTSYVVFEEAAPRTFAQLAFTADNTPIVMGTGGTLDRLEADGSSVPLDVPAMVRSIASLPAGDVIIAHDLGYSTTDGSTVTPADDLGLPPIEELAGGGLQAGRDHVWALGIVGLALGVDVYRSDGGTDDAFEIVNRIEYSGTFLDPDARIELRAAPDDVVEVWYSTSLDTLTSVSTDLGSSFSDADRPQIQARRRTSDGLLIGTGSAEVMWKEGPLARDAEEWDALKAVGVLDHNGGLQLWELDRDDHLWGGIGTRMYRSEHHITADHPGREIALAGPDCDLKHTLYDENTDLQFNPEFDVEIEHAGTEDTLVIYDMDPGVARALLELARVEPGTTTTIRVREGHGVLANDRRNLCRGVQVADTDGQRMVFE